MNDLNTKKIIVDGKEVEIVISIPKEEIEDNSDLFNLENTLVIEVESNE